MGRLPLGVTFGLPATYVEVWKVMAAADRQAHQDRAFEDFFRSHFAKLARWASLMVRDRSIGEEIAQEAFLGVLRAWDSFDSEEHARNYMYKSALNGARQLKRRAAVSARALRVLLPEPTSYEIEDSVASQHAILKALSHLSAKQRACVLLIDYVGLEASTVGSITGLSANAVRVTLHRARSKLRGLLEGGDTR